MKKIRIFATALLLAFTLSSCESFFDVELDDQAKIEDIFRQKTEVQKYLSHLYSYIPQEEEVVGMHGWTVGRADESLFSWYQWVYYTQFRTGNYSSATTNFNYWPDYYIGINQCSIFLKYIDLDKEDTPATLAYMKAEARFLRAYYYFLLFRQYGPVFIWGDQIADETIDGVTISADYFLQLAADAAWAIMEQNKYSLYKGNTLKLDAPYREYFILEDGDAKETILSMRFNADILVRHGIQFTFRNMRHSATQRLVNHYLMADGSKIQDQPGYETMTYNQQFQNRDPRMAQTLMAPGYVDLNGIDEVIEDCKSYDMTGYRFIKFVSDDTHNGATTSTTDWPVFRYPEILLTYAEAKAELGTLTPEDIALTVDVVRDRVGMPALDMTAANNNPDPLMASYYPNVNSGANKGVILEIRRERTVELPCEGLRQWDMLRWKEGAQLVPSSNGLDGFLGCYFPSLGEYDMNGDGKMDLCLWSGTKPATTCDAMLEIGEGKDAQLTEGTSGYIVCFRGRTYKWEEGRDYLWPIPTDQRVATGGALSQNPGYEDGLSF